MANTSRRTYFAAANRKEIGKRLTERLQTLLTSEEKDHREEMRNAFSHVFGRDVGYGITSGVTRGGDRGELALLRVNTATSSLRARHAIVSSIKVAWKPQASNGGAAAAEANGHATDVMEDEWERKGLNFVATEWLKNAARFSEWFVFTEWDTCAGPPLLAMHGKLKRQGDIRYHLVPAWDVYRDNAAKSYKACQWKFMRLPANRFDLAELHPQLPDGKQGEAAREAILGACETVLGSANVSDADKARLEDSDQVPVWHFFHEASPLLPLGRYVGLVGDLVLWDKPLRGPNSDYEGCPLYRLADEEMVDSPHAWAVFWDTLGAQEMKDGIQTAVGTRATTLSNPVMGVEKGSDLAPDVLANGWRAWGYLRGGKPPAEVEMNPVQKEMLDYDERLETAIRGMLGLNDAALGQPRTGEMNAQAFALLASMAVQQASPLQEAWTRALGELGTGVLKILSKRVSRPRMVVGAAGKPVQYTGDKLKGIDAVNVKIGNPMEQTAAGRKLILDDKLERGFVTTEEQYDQVLATGRSDSAMRRNTAEMTLVQREFEMLLRGESPPVDFYQNHKLHYRENSAAGLVTDDEEIKAVVTAHLDEHYFAIFGVDKVKDPLGPLRERWLLGMEPGPGQERPMAPPGAAPGAPPGAEPAAAGPAADAAMAPPGAVPPEAADVPMPENPLTGEEFDPASGGLPQ
jgi:hypothetical protein